MTIQKIHFRRQEEAVRRVRAALAARQEVAQAPEVLPMKLGKVAWVVRAAKPAEAAARKTLRESS